MLITFIILINAASDSVVVEMTPVRRADDSNVASTSRNPYPGREPEIQPLDDLPTAVRQIQSAYKGIPNDELVGIGRETLQQLPQDVQMRLQSTTVCPNRSYRRQKPEVDELSVMLNAIRPFILYGGALLLFVNAIHRNYHKNRFGPISRHTVAPVIQSLDLDPESSNVLMTYPSLILYLIAMGIALMFTK